MWSHFGKVVIGDPDEGETSEFLGKSRFKIKWNLLFTVIALLGDRSMITVTNILPSSRHQYF